MNIKKITAFAAAVVMAAGICTGVPVGTESVSPLAVTAEAASSDFVIRTDTAGYKCVAGYTGKGGDITIPKEAVYIAKNAFNGNDKITSVTIPKTCYDGVDQYAFSKCVNLKKVVFEGDAWISTGAFEKCINLESVTIKGSIRKYISVCAFDRCEKLKTVKISKNENDFLIGGGAFRDCHSLTSINIPSKCTEIYGSAFLNCFSLTKLKIPAKTKIVTESDQKYHFGYVALYNKKGEAFSPTATSKVFVADGKKSGYSQIYMTVAEADKKGDIYLTRDNILVEGLDKKFTPKQLTLTVTKGSPAEKWAKKNKVKYTYASSSSSKSSSNSSGSGSKAAAPANLDVTNITSTSVTLTWDKASGADFYRVYKYNEKTKKYEKCKDVTATKCTVSSLSPNTMYTFKVVSYSKNGDKSVQGGSSEDINIITNIFDI